MTTSKLERNLMKNRSRSFLFQLKGENTHAPLHHRSN